jgi:glutaredoxin
MLKFIRWFLGTIIVFFDRAFAPKAIQRSLDAQAKADELVRNMVLYQFETCPFCVKVRRALKRMNLKVELRDAKRNPVFAKDLVVGGGERQVPCLRISEPGTPVQWLYESDEIIKYLTERLAIIQQPI